jgi:diguanylate cyclase (GGDEF)-like protein/PAS domain S-box-containing protein
MKQSINRLQPAWTQVSKEIKHQGRPWITAIAVTASVLALRLSGVLQTLEWQAQDQFFRMRPLEPRDEKIIIIGIDEADLRQVGQWPIADDRLANLLQTVQAAQPRAIGLDIYRDLVVAPGQAKLTQAYREIPNLIGIQQLHDQYGVGVAPPPVLQKLGQIGFNNVIYDADRKVRRSLLYWPEDGQYHESFALKLGLAYLKRQGIQPTADPRYPAYLRLGQAVFPRFEANQGAYVRADAGGYQILANFRGPGGNFRKVSLTDVLKGRATAELRDRIVLIGSTAVSLKDFSATPYDTDQNSVPGGMAGVEMQANFISQIINAAGAGRPLLKVWPEPVGWLWLLVWSGVGTIISWRLRSPHRAILAMGLAGLGLTGACYLAFLGSWLVPLVPPLLGLSGAAIVMTGYLAHTQEELRRSKEFLHRVINSIPDPVFVKNQDLHWIVMNEAYSKFIGRPLEELLEKSDHDVFPKQEADILQQQDRLVLEQKQEQEHEGKVTRDGIIYHIATKRSLHQDAAGNLFLVGVIRDITQRKFREDDLKRATVELARSNAELRLSQERLSYLANHDVLTGLPNRKCFYERMTQALDWAGSKRQILAVMFLDLDGFKQINDTLGHQVGDVLLQVVAKRLMGCLRASDTVARFGGDEFVVILPAIPGAQDAVRVANKILGTLSQGFVITGQKILVSTSIGISLYPHDGENVDRLLEQADIAMYHAKESGKNQFAFAAAPARFE